MTKFFLKFSLNKFKFIERNISFPLHRSSIISVPNLFSYHLYLTSILPLNIALNIFIMLFIKLCPVLSISVLPSLLNTGSNKVSSQSICTFLVVTPVLIVYVFQLNYFLEHGYDDASVRIFFDDFFPYVAFNVIIISTDMISCYNTLLTCGVTFILYFKNALPYLLLTCVLFHTVSYCVELLLFLIECSLTSSLFSLSLRKS